MGKGFDFIGIPWGRSLFSDSEYQFFKKLRYWQKLLKCTEVLRLRREIIHRFVTNTELDDAIKGLKPDVLLIDLEMQAYVISTRHLRIPTILFFEMFSVWKTPGVPPLDSSFIPRERWFNRLVIEWLWFVWGVRRSLEVMRDKILRFGIDWLSVLKIFARHKQFPFHKEADRRHWLTPFVFRSLPVITTNVLEMEFSPNLPKNVHYVGPLISHRGDQQRADENFEEFFDHLTSRRQEEGRVRPLIYCSTSTYIQTDNEFLRTVIHVFEIKKDWDLILGLGNKMKAHELGSIPSNVFAFDWAPQLRVLEHANAAINHGGTTSINECIYFGVPMVVYSTKSMDHNGNAARVAYHRLGIVADKDKDKVEDVIQNIEFVLMDSNMKTNVLKMREVYLSYEKSNRAVSFVESFIKESANDK
ncbi:MAG: glycosyltransferase [Nitrospirales bacterium]